MPPRFNLDMANAGNNKKLASFNCDEELWGEFMCRCQEQGTTATATLTRFIQLYLDGELDNLNADILDERFENRVKACVDEYLEQRLPSYLDKYQANHQGQMTPTRPTPLSSPKEREFWFIQERARFLGVRLNADQVFRVNMFAADAYNERHGHPPSKKLYRNIYTTVYPKADVDILDPLIRGVAAKR